MSTRNSFCVAAAALTITGTSFAGVVTGFTGFSGVVSNYNDGSTDWTAINMYANFSDDTYAVLNVFNSNIFSSDGLGFHHNDLIDALGGSWKPEFSFDIPGAYDPMRDSYVTIGYGVGSQALYNFTEPDPSFNPIHSAYIPENAGWFNLRVVLFPQYAIGGRVHLGQFVMAADRAADFTFEAEIGYNTGPESDVFFGEGIFTTVPAPGALALLGLGGLIARRRRA